MREDDIFYYNFKFATKGKATGYKGLIILIEVLLFQTFQTQTNLVGN